MSVTEGVRPAAESRPSARPAEPMESPDHARPGPASLKRALRRAAVTIGGFAALLAGLVMLVTPGPGLAAIIGALGLLGTEYRWARQLHDKVKRHALSFARRVLARTPPVRKRRAVWRRMLMGVLLLGAVVAGLMTWCGSL